MGTKQFVECIDTATNYCTATAQCPATDLQCVVLAARLDSLFVTLHLATPKYPLVLTSMYISYIAAEQSPDNENEMKKRCGRLAKKKKEE